MVPIVPTFPPMVTLAPMVLLAAEKRSGFSGYQDFFKIQDFIDNAISLSAHEHINIQTFITK